MEAPNEIRYYLGLVKDQMEKTEWKPTHIVTAVMLPTGATEIAVNTEHIAEKIDYILDAYDDNMHLKTDDTVVIKNIMII